MNSFDDTILRSKSRSRRTKRRSLPTKLDAREILFGVSPKTKKRLPLVKRKSSKKSPQLRGPFGIIIPKPPRGVPTAPRLSPKKKSPGLRGSIRDKTGNKDYQFRISKLTEKGKLAKKCSEYTLADLQDILRQLTGKNFIYSKRIEYCNAIEKYMIENGLMSPGVSPTSPKAPTASRPSSPKAPTASRPSSPVSPRLRGTRKDNKGNRDYHFRISRLTTRGLMSKKCADYSLTELKDILYQLTGQTVNYSKKADYCNAIEKHMIESGHMSPGVSPITSPLDTNFPIAPKRSSPTHSVASIKTSSSIASTHINKMGQNDGVFRIIRGKGTGRDCKTFSIPELKAILYEITGVQVNYRLKAQYCKDIEEALRKQTQD